MKCSLLLRERGNNCNVFWFQNVYAFCQQMHHTCIKYAERFRLLAAQPRRWLTACPYCKMYNPVMDRIFLLLRFRICSDSYTLFFSGISSISILFHILLPSVYTVLSSIWNLMDITGAIPRTPTAAIEILLGLQLIHICEGKSEIWDVQIEN